MTPEQSKKQEKQGAVFRQPNTKREEEYRPEDSSLIGLNKGVNSQSDFFFYKFRPFFFFDFQYSNKDQIRFEKKTGKLDHFPENQADYNKKNNRNS